MIARFLVAIDVHIGLAGAIADPGRLEATLRFAPDPELDALGASDVWCHRRSDAEPFARRVLDSPAVAAVKDRPVLQRIVRWGMV